MNRGDARLLVVVLATAIVSSAATALITARLTSPSATDERLQRLDERITVLELVRKVSEVQVPRDSGLQPPAQPPLVLTPVAQPDPADCDEVSCVLDDYAPACCTRYGHPVIHHDGLPDSLDRAMISEGIANVKARVVACGDKHPNVKGTVSLSVRVEPGGMIAHETINYAADPALGACVQDAVSYARFAKTRDGGSFRYPFVF